MDLYHTEIGFPKAFVAPTARVSLEWSRHADAARTDDRYGVIPKFDTLPLAALTLIEIGVEAGRVAKMLYRGHFNADIDVCFVLIPKATGPWFVKTVWQNERNDTHKTLDRSKYVG